MKVKIIFKILLPVISILLVVFLLIRQKSNIKTIQTNNMSIKATLVRNDSPREDTTIKKESTTDHHRRDIKAFTESQTILLWNEQKNDTPSTIQTIFLYKSEGKYPYIRVEEIEKDNAKKIKIMRGNQLTFSYPSGKDILVLKSVLNPHKIEIKKIEHGQYLAMFDGQNPGQFEKTYLILSENPDCQNVSPIFLK